MHFWGEQNIAIRQIFFKDATDFGQIFALISRIDEAYIWIFQWHQIVEIDDVFRITFNILNYKYDHHLCLPTFENN